MNRFLFCVILTIFCCVSIYSQKLRNEKVVGVFRQCFVHCGTYYINPDFTFRHRFSGFETFGTWKFAGRNKIKLYAPGKKAEKVVLTKEDNGEKIEFTIPKVWAFKSTLFLENGALCAIYNKGKSKTCYQRIEAEQQNN